MTPHGGARPGAGRKPGPLGHAVGLPLRVPRRLLEAIDAECQRRGVTRSELIVDVLTRSMRGRGRLS